MRHYRAVLTLLVGALIALASPVGASVAGRRNTAIGATALSLYELARGKTGTGLLAGAGAYYAWNQYNKAHRRESRRRSWESSRGGIGCRGSRHRDRRDRGCDHRATVRSVRLGR